MTAKWQHLYGIFNQIEEGDTFGDSDNEQEAYLEAAISSDSDRTVEDPIKEDLKNIHTPTVDILKNNSVVPSTISESSTSRLSKIILDGSKDATKSKNFKTNKSIKCW